MKQSKIIDLTKNIDLTQMLSECKIENVNNDNKDIEKKESISIKISRNK